MSQKQTTRVRNMPPQPAPDFGKITADTLAAEVETILANSAALRDRLAGQLSPSTATFQNLVRPIVDDGNKANFRLRILGGFLSRVSPDPAIREASRSAFKKINAARTGALLRPDIASLVEAVAQKSHNDNSLDAEDRHLLSRCRGQYFRSGAGITDSSTRTRFEAAQAEINDILSAAQKDFADTMDGIWLTRSELSGTSDSWIATLDKGADGDCHERYWVTFRDDHYVHIMRSASAETTRRKMYHSKQQRFPENIARLSRLVLLRDGVARILGFKNHGALRMEERMEKDVPGVLAILQDISGTLAPLAKAEVEALRQLKNVRPRLSTPDDVAEDEALGGHDDIASRPEDSGRLYVWDGTYYSNQQAQRTGKIDHKAISEYFEASRVAVKMLGLFETMFGMRFEHTTEISVWDESVTAFTVWDDDDEGGAFLGYLYLDIFDRPGKMREQYHSGIQPGFVDANEQRYYPASALVCCFPKTTPKKPSLLQHRDVRILFHELGHAIHHLVERAKYAIPHSRDYAEIPSRMLEHFVWIPEVLVRLGEHYSHHAYGDFTEPPTDVPKPECGPLLPQAFAEGIAKTKFSNEATGLLNMLAPSMFDLALYTPESPEDAASLDTTNLWNTIRRNVLAFDLGSEDDETCFGQASFTPNFRNTDVGCFSYVLSSIYAADLFQTAFSRIPLSPETGKRWRRTVLNRGSSLSELGFLEDFLGRKLDTGAIFEMISHG